MSEPTTTGLDVYAGIARGLDPMELVPVRRACLRSRAREDGLVLSNPGVRAYALLGPEEAWLWERMDGSRAVKQLIVEYFQEFRSLAPARVLNLVAMLRARWMLEDDPTDVWAAVAARLQPLRTRWLHIVLGVVSGRIPLRLPDADGAFAGLFRALGGVVYSPVVRWGSLVVLGVGAAAFVFEAVSGRFAATSVTAPIVAVLLVVYGIQFTILTVHELAHGIECKRQGCTVNGLGITLFYGIPCLFVDTTDVWMADRRGRVATSWAGPYSGFVFSGALALVALVAPAPWGAALFQVAFLVNFAAVFNLLPFVEMDGYYMLVDWLSIPMLRARSIGFLRTGFASRMRAKAGLSRLETTYVLFGFASFVTGIFFAALGLWYWLGQAQNLFGAAWRQGVAVRFAMLALGVLLLLPLLQHLSKRAALSKRVRRVRVWVRRNLPSTTSDARMLVATGIVADADEDVAREMLERMQRRSYRAGSLLIQEGEPGDEFFVIRRGDAAVVRGPEEEELTRLGEGDYFGEIALVERSPRAATVRALTRLDVLAMSRGDFDRLVADHVEITARVDRMMSASRLGRFSVLEHLTSEHLHQVQDRLARTEAGSGEVIFEQGEPGDRFYLIDSGQVEVVRDGERLAILGADDYFGETALVDDRPRNATARSMTPVTLYSMDRSAFDAFLRGVVSRKGVPAWTAGSASAAH